MPVSPIVIEDGTGVANANSYVERDEAVQYAADQGVTFADDSTTDVLLYSAMRYLETFRNKYVGTIVDPAQSLAWPREDVVIADADWPDNTIPPQLKNAQMQLAIYAKSTDLMPSVFGAFVLREKVGPIETEYSQAVRSDGQPYFPLIDSMLSDLLTVAGGFSLVSVRA